MVGREDMSSVFKMQMQASSAVVVPGFSSAAADRGCGPRRTRLLRSDSSSGSLIPAPLSTDGRRRRRGGALPRSSRRVSRGILLRTRISDWSTSGNAESKSESLLNAFSPFSRAARERKKAAAPRWNRIEIGHPRPLSTIC